MKRSLRYLICLLAVCVLFGSAVPVLGVGSGITVSPTAITLVEGSTAFLRADPAEGTEWSSDRPEVALVNAQGEVTAVSTGTAHIIAARDGAAALCTVTVEAAEPGGLPAAGTEQPGGVPVTGVELLKPTDASVSAGFQLSARVLPENAANQAVIWTSSDPTRAAVDPSGYVSLLDAGPVVITVTTVDGGFSDTLSFTVRSSQTAVTGIELGQQFLQLARGATAFLTVTVLPEDAADPGVTWQSLDPAVATVAETGAITGVAGGKTKIVAATADGGFTAECTVIVPPENAMRAVQGVTLDHDTLDLAPNETALLKAELESDTPVGAPLQINPVVYWASSAPTVAQVDDAGCVTALAPGRAAIYAVAAGGCQAVCRVLVTAPTTETAQPDEEDPTFPRTETYTGFSDVDESAWYGAKQQGVVKTAVELGIMNGDTAGTFRPGDNIKLCEAIKMAAVVHNLYNGGKYAFALTDPWYDAYISYAVRFGIIREDDFQTFEKEATRGEMAYIFCNALPGDYLPRVNDGVEVADVDLLGLDPARRSEYSFEIYFLYQAGVLTGDDAVTRAFRPKDPVTRAEAAAIIARLCLPELRVVF